MLDAAQLAWELSQRCEDLVRQLFPAAEVRGHELRWIGPDGQWWSMNLVGARRGIWAGWGDQFTGPRGDALELVHWVLFPGETGRRESCQWAARWLGHDPRADEDPEMALARRRAAMERRQQIEQELKERALKRQRGAIARYLDGGVSVPVPRSPEIESYLFGRLGVRIEELPGVPRSLRFSPSHSYDGEIMLPAMLAPMVDPMTHQQIATHATFLSRDRAGVWRKASVAPAKKVYGAPRGGIIPLLRGASKKPLRDAPPGDRILIAEGIENALAAAMYVDGDPRVVACYSVGNLAAIELPDVFDTVILAYDRDGENEGVRKARAEAEQNFLERGHAIEWLKPPAGIKDFADLMLRQSDAA